MKRFLLHLVCAVVMLVPAMAYGECAKIKFDNTMHNLRQSLRMGVLWRMISFLPLRAMLHWLFWK